MAETKIEWADKTWNPITGCTPISEGCQNCYAEHMSKRLAGRCGYPKDKPFAVTIHRDKFEQPLHWKKPSRIFVCSMGDLFHEDVPDEFIAKVWDVMWECSQHTFLVLTKRPERMKQWVENNAYKKHFDWVESKTPFLPGDLIHIDDLWMRNMCGWESSGKCDCNGGYICDCPPDNDSDTCEHGNRLCMSYNCPIATNDPSEKALEANDLKGQYEIDEEGYSIDCDWMELHTRPRNAFAQNVWLGVTAENQQRADERIPILLQTPAAKRFVSIEPMLGPIILTNIDTEMAGHKDMYFVNALTGKHDDMSRPCNQLNKLDWVICGGETGPGARPLHPDWVRSLRDQCKAAGTPFFFKSWGDWVNPDQTYSPYNRPFITHHFVKNKVSRFGEKDPDMVIKMGKKKAGRLLDGVDYSEYPEARP